VVAASAWGTGRYSHVLAAVSKPFDVACVILSAAKNLAEFGGDPFG
jgi:hypothetical protein